MVWCAIARGKKNHFSVHFNPYVNITVQQF